MQFSERWLRTLTDPPLDTAALCDAFTMAGLEVEKAVPAAPPFEGVVVGRIERVEPHPNADRLRVCTVDVGSGAPLAIVCGAPNAAAGMKAPCARVGALLPGGLAIRTAAVRGVESNGMLCSAKELGISDDASGLLVLPADAAVGADLRQALALDDTIIELKVTPNRADCLSLVGLARELSAATAAPLALPEISPVAVTSQATRQVRVEDEAGCPRFASRVIEGIDPKAPTPAWMVERLERSGIRSISAVVDITNYVMLEQGQPLHAYDDRLLDGAVVVRFAREGEKLTLLNGQVLALEPDLLMVCDEKRPLGLAGIMGGEHSGISEATATVFLEGAFWSPAVIQGRSRRLGFVSDAGYRFERGVDFGNTARAVERATHLILETCGGRAGPLSDVRGVLPSRGAVRVRPARVERILGIAVDAGTMAALFGRLGFTFIRDGADFVVTPPTARFDLAIEEDFIEEIARLVGYDAIPARPAAHVQTMLPDPEARQDPATLKERLAARDWQETITFGFVGSELESALFPERGKAEAPIAVLNPIATHLDVMRTTLAGSLLEVLRTNLARKHERVRIFEVGRCFRRNGGDADQPLRIGGLAYGHALPEQWGASKRPVDFHDVKGDLEVLAAPRALATVAAPHPLLHPGRAAMIAIAGETVGWLGQLHPRLVRRFELAQPPILFEIDVAPLLERPVPTGRPVSKLPMVRRDFAVVLDESIPASAVMDALAAAAPPRVVAMRPFDVYRGPGLPSGGKSLAILVLMQDTERTLTDAEIDATVAALVKIITDKFGATLRSQVTR